MFLLLQFLAAAKIDTVSKCLIASLYQRVIMETYNNPKNDDYEVCFSFFLITFIIGFVKDS